MDIAKAAKTDMILSNGLGLERRFKRFVADSPAIRVTLNESVTPINISEGEYQGHANPHAWMFPKNGQLYVDNIVKTFSSPDPEHAADYQKNGTA